MEKLCLVIPERTDLCNTESSPSGAIFFFFRQALSLRHQALKILLLAGKQAYFNTKIFKLLPKKNQH